MSKLAVDVAFPQQSQGIERFIFSGRETYSTSANVSPHFPRDFLSIFPRVVVRFGASSDSVIYLVAKGGAASSATLPSQFITLPQP